ncbi:MAG: hypothetical protein ABI175_05635 [Polyangiales bacterium]
MMAAPHDRPRGGALGFVVVAGGILLVSWLALRTMGQRLGEGADAGAAPSATTGRDESKPLVPMIPQQIVADAGKTPIARIDLVLRVDGVDVSSEGAPACRQDNHTTIRREPSTGTVGSFDEGALRTCLLQVMTTIQGKRPVATLTRAGDAVPTTYFEALVAAIKRTGVTEVVASP